MGKIAQTMGQIIDFLIKCIFLMLKSAINFADFFYFFLQKTVYRYSRMVYNKYIINKQIKSTN